MLSRWLMLAISWSTVLNTANNATMGLTYKCLFRYPSVNSYEDVNSEISSLIRLQCLNLHQGPKMKCRI